MKKSHKEYEIGDKIVDGLITELANQSVSEDTVTLLREILTTVIKLGRESSDPGDLKLVNNSLKELRYSFKVFSRFRNVKKVTIFGSARTPKSAVEYAMAEDFSKKMTEKGYMVVTGGGPGIMEVGNKGALPGKDFALNIRLPYEQKLNPYIDEHDKTISYKYFFIRKLVFIKETDATVLFPGGFGTHDEGFEMLTLVQTGKSKPRPIVFIEPHHSTYWIAWKEFIKTQLAEKGYIDKDDLHLFKIVNTVDDAVHYLEEFYRVYHSLRYISGMTIIRLNRMISEETLKHINHEFKDILLDGVIAPSDPTEKEIEMDECLDLPRISLRFNMRRYGRLYELIHAINKD